MARLMTKVSWSLQKPAGRAPVLTGWTCSVQSGSLRGMCKGPLREPRPGLTRRDWRELRSAQETRSSAAGPGYGGTAARAGLPEHLFVPFFYLHSRGKDFNSVFGRHSDDVCSARVPGRATVAATSPPTESCATWVSWLCPVTPWRC